MYKKRIEDFFTKSDVLKTFNNLCIHLDLTKDDFLALLKDPEYAELLTKSHERCEAWLIDNGLSNPKSGNFTQFLLRHQFDYVEKEAVEDTAPTKIVFSLA